MAKMTDKINIWDNITGVSRIASAMYNWRTWMGQDFSFEKFRDTYMMPLDEYASTIICPRQCGYCELGNRRIVEMKDGSFEAICDEMCGKEIVIDRQETLYYTIKESALVPAIAKVMGITPYTAKLEKSDSSWKVGSINVKGENVQVFLTLKWQDRYLLELIFNLNRIVHDKYILLGSKQSIMSHGLTDLLHDGGGTFVPLNETLDFNDDAELELVRPFSWEKIMLSPEELTEEPENIFRKCGDAWEIRYDGGEKFMLLEVDLGAQYIHFLLQNPYENISVLRITSSMEPDFKTDQVSGFDDGFSIISHPDEGDAPFADSVAIGQYRKEERELIQEIENARNAGDNVWQKQLESDLKQIRVAINQAISPAGQYKLLNDPIKNASNSLRNAVNRAIYKIQKYDMNFGSHLKSNIHFGQNIVYSSPERICWEL